LEKNPPGLGHGAGALKLLRVEIFHEARVDTELFEHARSWLSPEMRPNPPRG